jgi:DNA repair exonuclease SbcCD ATPase subunit
MHIKRIDIRNIRGFEKPQFDLTRPNGSYEGWTVFTGDNGSGKSTLFKAIAACLVIKRSSKEPTLEAALPPLGKANYHTLRDDVL